IGERHADDRFGEAEQLLQAWDRQEEPEEVHDPEDRAQHRLDDLVDTEKDGGLREIRLDEFRAIADLALAPGDGLSVQDLDDAGDMGRLDEIEDVFAREIERDARQSETDQPAPECTAERCVGIARDMAEAIADDAAGADGEKIGKADPEIDEHAK